METETDTERMSRIDRAILGKDITSVQDWKPVPDMIRGLAKKTTSTAKTFCGRIKRDRAERRGRRGGRRRGRGGGRGEADEEEDEDSLRSLNRLM